MNEEGKAAVAGYMGWILSDFGGGYYYIPKNLKVIHFDLNDASLCVQEMQRRGDLPSFIKFSWSVRTQYIGELNTLVEYMRFIFIAENFFSAMVEYLEQKEKEG